MSAKYFIEFTPSDLPGRTFRYGDSVSLQEINRRFKSCIARTRFELLNGIAVRPEGRYCILMDSSFSKGTAHETKPNP